MCVYACVCCERTQAYWRHSGRCDLFMHSERRFHILAASARSFVIPRERAQRQERGRECASEPKMTSPPPAGSHRELPVQAAPTTGASTLPPPAYAVPTIIFLFFFNAQLTAVEIKKRIRKQPNNSDTSEKSCCSHWCPWEKLGRWVNTTALHVGAACRLHVGAACRRCMSAHALSRCSDVRSKRAALPPVCPACLQGGSGRAIFFVARSRRAAAERPRPRTRRGPSRKAARQYKEACLGRGLGLLKKRALIDA